MMKAGTAKQTTTTPGAPTARMKRACVPSKHLRGRAHTDTQTEVCTRDDRHGAGRSGRSEIAGGCRDACPHLTFISWASH